MLRKIKISEICEALDLNYIGTDVEINGLNLCNRGSEHDCILTYVTSDRYADVIAENQAVAAIVVKEEFLSAYQMGGGAITFILCEQPEKIFYDIHDYLWQKTDFYDKSDFPAVIGENCRIDPSAVIEAGVRIGNHVEIGPNTVIRRGTVIHDHCQIGCNTTIGSEGFQILRINGQNRKIRHCGGVMLEAGVFVGDQVCVCNSLFEGYTHIGQNAKIDNLVHVAHNVSLGRNAVITAGVILCGSSIVQDNAWIGVNSSVLNRVTIGDNAMVGIGSVVTRDVPEEALAYGVPAKVKG